MYPTGTTFRYFLSDSVNHYTAVMMKDGRVLEVKNPDSTEKETYEDLDEWLMSLPGDVHESDLSINGVKQDRFTPEDNEYLSRVEKSRHIIFIRKLYKFKNYLFGNRAVIKALYDFVVAFEKLPVEEQMKYSTKELVASPFIFDHIPLVYQRMPFKLEGNKLMAKWLKVGQEILKVMPNILTELEKQDLSEAISQELGMKRFWELHLEKDTKNLNNLSEAVKKTTELLKKQTEEMNKYPNLIKYSKEKIEGIVERTEAFSQRLQELSH